MVSRILFVVMRDYHFGKLRRAGCHAGECDLSLLGLGWRSCSWRESRSVNSKSRLALPLFVARHKKAPTFEPMLTWAQITREPAGTITASSTPPPWSTRIRPSIVVQAVLDTVEPIVIEASVSTARRVFSYDAPPSRGASYPLECCP